MEIQFNCDKEDLIGAHLAGLGEDSKIKAKRIVFILMPLSVMIGLVICYQHFFHLESPNTILLPIAFFGFAALYLWGVKSNRHYRANIIVEKQLKESGETILGDYTLKIQDKGLEIVRIESNLVRWEDILNIVANGDYCQIRIQGKDDIVIAANKLKKYSDFTLFVRLCVTMHYYIPRSPAEEPVKKSERGDVSDLVVTQQRINNPNLGRLKLFDK